MKPVSQVLEEAADLLAKPGAWTQGESARDRRGRPAATLGEGAVCFCAIGAINRVTQNTYWLKDTPQAFFDDFVEAPERGDLCKAAAWNDAPGRTQPEVVAKLREAAALAKEQGR